MPGQRRGAGQGHEGSRPRHAHFAALALVKIDPENKQTLPLLVKGLEVADKDVRLSILYALEQMGPKVEGVLRVFGEALKDPARGASRRRRCWPVSAPRPGGVVPAPAPGPRGQGCVGARYGAAAALAAVAPATARRLCRPWSGCSRTRMRRMRGAAYVLGQVGPAAKEAVPALKELLRDPKGEVRQAAAAAVKKIESRQ